MKHEKKCKTRIRDPEDRRCRCCAKFETCAAYKEYPAKASDPVCSDVEVAK